MTKFLTVNELSKLLQIPKRSIYLFAQTGIIPGAFKIGRHWRFRQDMVEQWIDEQTKSKVLGVDSSVHNPAKKDP